MLQAGEAKVTGNLRIQGVGDKATIHYWNKTEDKISWECGILQKGNYKVAMNYSLDKAMKGGKISFTAGDQQIITLAEPSGSWSDFRTFELGIVNIDKTGTARIVLQAAQLPDVQGAALPDVFWLSLTPTNETATSKPLN